MELFPKIVINFCIRFHLRSSTGFCKNELYLFYVVLLGWCCAHGLLGSQIPVTTGGLEL